MMTINLYLLQSSSPACAEIIRRNEFLINFLEILDFPLVNLHLARLARAIDFLATKSPEVKPRLEILLKRPEIYWKRL